MTGLLEYAEQQGVLEGELLDEAMQVCERHQNGMPVVQSRDCVFQALDTKEMSASFTIVTRGSGLNRHGNKVQIVGGGSGEGILLGNYATNPQVLFQHGFAATLPFPIGQSAPRGSNDCTVKLFQAKADAKVYFSQVLPEAALIFALVEEGQLRTSSIGFIPLKAMLIKQKPPKDEEGPKGELVLDLARPWVALDFLTSDLIEWSIVDIPADAGALRKHLELGKIGGEKITDRFRPVLKQMAGEKKLITPGWGHGIRLAFSRGDTRFEVQSFGGENMVDVVERAGQMFEKLAAPPVEKTLTEKRAAYGYCPECGAPGKLRERRPNGNDSCENGHVYPSKEAKTQRVDATEAPAIVEHPKQEAAETAIGEGTLQTELQSSPAVVTGPQPPVLTSEVIQQVVQQCLQEEVSKLAAGQAKLQQRLALATGQVV